MMIVIKCEIVLRKCLVLLRQLMMLNLFALWHRDSIFEPNASLSLFNWLFCRQTAARNTGAPVVLSAGDGRVKYEYAGRL